MAVNLDVIRRDDSSDVRRDSTEHASLEENFMSEGGESKMSLNPLAPVTDYSSMLYRIFICTTVAGIIATRLIRLHCKPVDDYLKYYDIPVDLGIIKDFKALGFLLPAVLIALFARVIKLHNRVSDLLGIRTRFDVDEILRPLAEGSGFAVGSLNLDSLRKNRQNLMERAFYRYASYSDAKINKHLIQQAYDWWSWYWVILESAVIFIPVGIALLVLRSYSLGFMFLAICLIVVPVVLIYFRTFCVGYAHREVDAILDDATRKAEVRAVFDAL